MLDLSVLIDEVRITHGIVVGRVQAGHGDGDGVPGWMDWISWDDHWSCKLTRVLQCVVSCRVVWLCSVFAYEVWCCIVWCCVVCA
jgi:hypothetical protein